VGTPDQPAGGAQRADNLRGSRQEGYDFAFFLKNIRWPRVITSFCPAKCTVLRERTLEGNPVRFRRRGRQSPGSCESKQQDAALQTSAPYASNVFYRQPPDSGNRFSPAIGQPIASLMHLGDFGVGPWRHATLCGKNQGVFRAGIFLRNPHCIERAIKRK